MYCAGCHLYNYYFEVQIKNLPYLKNEKKHMIVLWDNSSPSVGGQENRTVSCIHFVPIGRGERKSSFSFGIIYIQLSILLSI